MTDTAAVLESVCVPLAAVSVYTVSMTGLTCVVPEAETAPMPWSIETDVELETSQDRVDDWPLLIEVGDAENELMVNGLEAGVEGVVGVLFLQC